MFQKNDKIMAMVRATIFALAGLNTIAMAAPADSTPMQIHLAYAGSTGMMVSWNTYCQLEQPTVRYGL